VPSAKWTPKLTFHCQAGKRTSAARRASGSLRWCTGGTGLRGSNRPVRASGRENRGSGSPDVSMNLRHGMLEFYVALAVGALKCGGPGQVDDRNVGVVMKRWTY
jgi:hypothetical protein